MSALSIQPPYPIFSETDGQPLEDGFVWLGVANLDPQVNPISVFWDAALTIPAAQPIRTINGYPSSNGTPARLYVNSDYSIRVMNRNGSVVYSSPAATERYSDVVVSGVNAEDVIYDPPFLGGVQTNVEEKLAQTVSVKDFGAVGDGVTDDTAAFAAASTASAAIIMPPGNYLIGTSISISSQIKFDAGAKLLIGSGVTVTFSGQVISGPYQIFQVTSTGSVVFDFNKTVSGCSEWWGAVPNSPEAASTNRAAINRAVQSLPVTTLLCGDYWVDGTIKLNAQHRSLIGISEYYNDTSSEVSRIVCTSSTDDIIQFGPDSQPATINEFYQGIAIKNVYLGRSVAPDISSGCCGLNARWTLYGKITGVKAADSIVGFRFNGTVATSVFGCNSVRAQAGTGAGTDYFYGYWIDGSGSIGAAGGNASLYIDGCQAGCNFTALQSAGSIGFYLSEAFTDTFLTDIETVSFYNGLVVAGQYLTGNTYVNTDCHISHAVMDQFTNAGVFISDIAESGSIEIVDPYCGPNISARASIWLNHNLGAVRVTGGQLVHGGAPGAQPIIIANSAYVELNETIVLEAGPAYAAVGIGDGMIGGRIAPFIKNVSVTGAAAVQISGACTGVVFAPIVSGKTSAFTLGIQVVGATDTRCSYDVGAINSDAIAGGFSNKLVRNGMSAISSATQVPVYSGTNFVTGCTG